MFKYIHLPFLFYDVPLPETMRYNLCLGLFLLFFSWLTAIQQISNKITNSGT